MTTATDRRWRKGTLALLMIGGTTLLNLPFVWMILASIRPSTEVFEGWLPKTIRLGNYIDAWQAAPFGLYFLNSFVVSSSISLSHVFLGALAAYAFAKLRFRGRNLMFGLFLAAMMIPGEVVLIPNFITLRYLGWLDSYRGLIVPHLSSIFAIFLLRQFFLTIPRDLDDAATVDGCGRLYYLFRVVMPLSLPALLTVGLFSFLASWNDLLWPLVVTNSDRMRVVQVGILAFRGEHGIDYGSIMAATTMVTVPIVGLFLLVQRHFTQGIAMAGLKA